MDDDLATMAALQKRTGKRVVRALLGIASLVITPFAFGAIGAVLGNDGAFGGLGWALIGFFGGTIAGVAALVHFTLSGRTTRA